jgi:hypothetical protein
MCGSGGLCLFTAVSQQRRVRFTQERSPATCLRLGRFRSRSAWRPATVAHGIQNRPAHIRCNQELAALRRKVEIGSAGPYARHNVGFCLTALDHLDDVTVSERLAASL